MRPLIAAVSLLTALLVPTTASATTTGTVTFEGGGWGHSIGMSQYGAQGMALLDGLSGEDIVKHYYRGTSVEQLTQVLPPDNFLVAYSEPLWVGLLQNQTSFQFIARGGDLTLCQEDDNQGCPKSVTPQDGQLWTFEKVGSNCRFMYSGVQQGNSGACSAGIASADGVRVELPGTGRSYPHGTLKIRPAGGGFHVSLATAIEHYVLGIAETLGGWEPAAHDAQALAARSFGLAKAQQRETVPRAGTSADAGLSPKWKDICWCHVRRTPVDQNFIGWTQEQKVWWADAVARTTGQVITHPDDAFTENGIIEAFYSSSSSGVTETNVGGFGSAVQYPYLQSEEDRWGIDPAVGNPNATWKPKPTETAADVIDALANAFKSTGEPWPWQVSFDQLTGVELVNGPPEAKVRFTGSVDGVTISVEATGRWLNSTFGWGRSPQVTGVSSELFNETPTEGPVVYATHVVDDGPRRDNAGDDDSVGNDDGVAQCGETIELYVSITNRGSQTLTDVTGFLTVNDAFATLLWNTSSKYPDIGVDATMDNDNDWDIALAAATPDGHSVDLELLITSQQGGPWIIDVPLIAQCEGGEPLPPVAESVALHDPSSGIWHLRRSDESVDSFYYGNPLDVPFAGDWDGDGVTTLGLYRVSAGFLFLRNSNTQGNADVEIFYGNPQDLPVAGDWDGNGVETIGIFRPSDATFYLRNTNTQGVADVEVPFGQAGDVPLAGDWDGDGVDTVGVYRPSSKTLYLTNSLTNPTIDREWVYSNARSGDRMIMGDWDGDGVDTIGVYRPSDATFYLRDTYTQPSANISIVMGDSGMGPVAGYWGP